MVRPFQYLYQNLYLPLLLQRQGSLVLAVRRSLSDERVHHCPRLITGPLILGQLQHLGGFNRLPRLVLDGLIRVQWYKEVL